MSTPLKFSDAVNLALHAAALLAADPKTAWSVTRMAQTIQVSQAHLAKVMQQLAKARIVHAVRGPKGGYSLVAHSQSVSLLRVYQAVEGELHSPECLLGHPVCGGPSCALSDMMHQINMQIRTYLQETTIADLAQGWLQNQSNAETKTQGEPQ